MRELSLGHGTCSLPRGKLTSWESAVEAASVDSSRVASAAIIRRENSRRVDRSGTPVATRDPRSDNYRKEVGDLEPLSIKSLSPVVAAC